VSPHLPNIPNGGGIAESNCSRDSSASLIPPAAASTPSPSAADIARVVEEHKAREARRLEKAKAKDDAGDSKDEDKQKNKSKDPASPAASTPPGTASPAPSSGPQHRQFELHRSIFAMRQRELKTREQGAKAKEVGKGELQS
jgi:hypothetical protein